MFYSKYHEKPGEGVHTGSGVAGSGYDVED